jgi:hypothetical protein
MKYLYSFLVMFLFINTVYSQDFDQVLDRATMDNFIVIEDRLNSLADESDQVAESVSEYMSIMLCIAPWIFNGWSEEDITIKEMIDSVAEAEQPEIITQLFDEYHIKNGYYQSVIAGFIINVLIYENVLLGKFPELMGNPSEDFDKKDIDTYLERVNRFLSSFDDNDVALVREYMDAIVQEWISRLEYLRR